MKFFMVVVLPACLSAAAGGPGAKSHLPQALVKRMNKELKGDENRAELLHRALPPTPEAVAQLPRVFLTAKHNRRRRRFLFNPLFTFTSSNPNRAGKVSLRGF